jgi:Flp pilus assembly secretin CpaC
MRISQTAAVMTLLLSTLSAPGPASAFETILVTQDQARVLRIAGPAATIIIGNPAIADATMHNSSTLVITGRTSGSTNLIVLDVAGETVAEHLISVEGPVAHTVSLFRGAQRFSLSCAPTCQPNVVPGDSVDYFKAIAEQNAIRTGFATGTAVSPTE